MMSASLSLLFIVTIISTIASFIFVCSGGKKKKKETTKTIQSTRKTPTTTTTKPSAEKKTQTGSSDLLVGTKNNDNAATPGLAGAGSLDDGRSTIHVTLSMMSNTHSSQQTNTRASTATHAKMIKPVSSVAPAPMSSKQQELTTSKVNTVPTSLISNVPMRKPIQHPPPASNDHSGSSIKQVTVSLLSNTRSAGNGQKAASTTIPTISSTQPDDGHHKDAVGKDATEVADKDANAQEPKSALSPKSSTTTCIIDPTDAPQSTSGLADKSKNSDANKEETESAKNDEQTKKADVEEQKNAEKTESKIHHSLITARTPA